MAGHHSVDAWKNRFKSNSSLLSHPERLIAQQGNSKPFAVKIRSVENLIQQGSGGQYQLRCFLYDSAFQQFVGQTWCGPWIKAAQSSHSDRLTYNQSIVFHTPIIDAGLLVVIEVVYMKDSDSELLSNGWTFFQLFKVDNSKDMPDCSRGMEAPLRIPMYHGSPRALLFMNTSTTGHITDSAGLTKITQCELVYGVFTHKALSRVQNLLPENVFLHGNGQVPGLASKGLLGKPRLRTPHPCFIDKVRLTLSPNIDMFEEILCRTLNADRVKREGLLTADGRSVQIMKRSLQVGIHNGLTYIDEPVMINLTEDSAVGPATLARKASIRNNRNNSATHQMHGGSSLIHKHRIQLEGLLSDPDLVVVFLLIYECSVPQLAAFEKASIATASFPVGVRFAAFAPLAFAQADQAITLELLGGPELSPDGLLLFRGTPTAQFLSPELNEDIRKLGGGEISFRVHHEPLPGAAPVQSGYKEATYRSNNNKYQDPGDDSPPNTPPSLNSSVDRGLGLEDLQSHAASTQKSQKKSSRPQLAPSMPTTAFENMSQSNHYPVVQSYRQQAIMAAPPHLPPGYMPIEIQHITNEAILEQESHLGTAVDLKELPFTPVHAPIMPVVPGMHSGQKLPRAAYAQLYSAGFPPVLDRHGNAAEVMDPQDIMQFVPTKEENDRLSANEIYFQFLAFARASDAPVTGQHVQPTTVFFTFQFYRFPQVTTQRLLLGNPKNEIAIDNYCLPCLLHQLDKDGSVRKGPPGYQIKYDVDPSYLKSGETHLFLNHLANQTLHIDVWDGDSMHLLGSCAVELINLCRQGREAVQVTYELDIVQHEYIEHDGVGVQAGDMTKEGAVHPVQVQLIPKGKLHLRLANVGHMPEGKINKQEMLFTKTKHLVISEAGTGAFMGGSLNSMGTKTKPLLGTKVSKAQPLVESNRDLASVLFTKKEKFPEMSQMDSDKRRKLMRMQAIRNEGNVPEADSKIVPSFRLGQETRLRDLKTIEFYRMQDKKEGILQMLSRAMTTEHTIHPAMGNVEFFEFSFRNPTNYEQTLIISSDDPELSVVTDYREWRHLKLIKELFTPIEEGLFNLEGKSGKPEIFVRPKEKVLLPIKYLTLKADHSVKPTFPAELMKENQEKKLISSKQTDPLQPHISRLTLSTPEGKPLAILAVRIEPQPHVVDQTFRFYQPEHSFLKKNIRLPSVHSVAGLPVGGAGYSQLYVRCSDPNVICDSRKVQQGEPHDVFIKATVGAAPQIKRFFVAIYTDPYLSRPLQTWQFLIHAMQRIDVACVEGQTSRFSLVLRGTQSSRLVQVYSSHAHEMTVEPSKPFMLPANTIQELSVGVRPIQSGSKFLQLNVVDVDAHQVVRNWLVCVSARTPVISKVFELKLPLGGGKGSNKRIAYTNPYPRRKLFHLLTNREDLLQFKESQLEIGGGESASISLKFAPHVYPATIDILVFLNDEDDKSEEAFCIKATYQ